MKATSSQAPRLWLLASLLAAFFFNWPVLAVFRDEMVIYLFAAWFAIVVILFVISLAEPAPGKRE